MLDLEITTKPVGSRSAITVKVLKQPVTEHLDESGNIQTAIIADPIPLAEWFAANWWRLRWEPEKENLDIEQQYDWNLSHRLAAAGAGYIWPNIQFASDDLAVQCTARQTTGKHATIRFIRSVNEWLSAAQFEAGVDSFINEIANSAPSSNLAALWREVLVERQNLAATDWRKLEAKAGYDPDEAPAELITGLQSFYSTFGKTSVEELSSENRGTSALSTANDLLTSFQHSKHSISPDLTGFQAQRTNLDTAPWRQAAEAAAWVRNKLGIKAAKPITNEIFLDYLGTTKTIFEQQQQVSLATAGLKKVDTSASVLLSPGRDTAQRFALARLLGDCLYTINQEETRLLSTTNSKTSRQKFQRAFAQELLCPYQGLREYMETDHPNEESLEKMADHYHVSPLTVRYTLENKQL